jgi:Tfp pilus assembly protein PilE
MIQRHASRGFTIIEVVVIITILALLVGLSYFFIGDWRARAATNEVKSDLNGAASALENIRNFSNGYPATLTNTVFEPTDTVELDYTLRGDGSYCLIGTSTERSTVVWFVDSRANKQPLQGSCS